MSTRSSKHSPASSTVGVPKTTTANSDTTAVADKPAASKAAAPAGAHGGMQAPLELPRWRFWAIFISLMLCIFLFSLDQLIVATALPKITEQFNALTQLSWITSGFFLTLLGFNLIYSQLLQIFPSKFVLLLAVFIFEIGSLVCGVAPSIEVLILGRAIAGVGAAGIFSGAMIVVAEITPLHNRAQYFALIGVCFAIASVLGPLVGGAFSDHVTWRWCFYINLPFGGLAMGCLLVFQPTRPPLGRAATYKGMNKSMVWDVLKCDWVAVVIAMGWACSFILWLQWGGVTKAWNDGSVIACIVLSAVLIPVFVAYEWWMGESAMFKLHLVRRRTIAGGSVVLFCLFAVFMFAVTYLAEAYQAVYHSSATSSGVKLLPLILVQIATLMITSRIIPKVGRFKYIICGGPCFLMLACGLLYTVKYGTPESHLYGFQVILGVGIGMALQNTMIAAQFELKSEPKYISAGTGLVVFIGFAGRIFGISLAENVFENMMKVNLHKYAPGLDEAAFEAVLNSAAAVWTSVSEAMRPAVLTAYTQTLRDVYIIGVPLGFIGLCGGLCIKNSRMQTKEEEEAAIKASREKAALEAAGEPVPASTEKAAANAEFEAEEAEAIAASAPMPEAAAEGGVDAQVLVDKQAGRSAV